MPMGACDETEHQDLHVWLKSAQSKAVTMVLVESSQDINQKHSVGNCTCEFTLTPRALIAPSGSVLPCTGKSKIIHLLNKLSLI